MSLRRNLILLAAVCLLPAVALLTTSQMQLRHAREAEVRREVFGLAASEAGEVNGVIEAANQLLTALEQSPPIRERNAPLCSALLNRLQREYRSYASLDADDPSGRAYCSSTPGQAGYDGNDTAFRTARDERRFAVGRFTVAAANHAPVLPMARPVIAPDGTLLGVLVVSLDLDWLARDLAAKLPPGAAVTVADGNDTVLLHVPDNALLAGAALPPAFTASMPANGTATDARGPDGAVRIIAASPAGDPATGLRVIAQRSRAEAFAALDHATRDGLMVIVGGLMLALLVAIWMAHRLIQLPVRALLATADGLRQGEYGRRSVLTSEGSELGRLGRALNALAVALQAREQERDVAEQELLRFNATLEQRVAERTQELQESNARLATAAEERQRAQMALAQAQKLDAVGQLTGGVAHDFNNLLAAILGSLEIVMKRVDEPRARRMLTVAMEAAERGAKLTRHMLAFSRKQDLVLQPVDVNATIAGMSDLLRRTIGGRVRVHHDLADELWPATADPVQLEVAFLNLAVNARDAMPDGGGLTFRTRNVTVAESSTGQAALPPGEYAMVTVSDTGAGMPEDVQARAFEPFFTTKGPGKGTGLGLSMVYGFACQAGGTATIDSIPGKGTAISLYLPRSATAPSAATDQPAEAAPLPAQRILLVDDDAAVRETLREMLRDLGHDVIEANSGASALALLRQSSAIALLLADFAMPEMTGLQLAMRARLLQPGLAVLLMTGHAEGDARQAWSVLRIHSVLKPFAAAELAAAMREALLQQQAAPPD
jgi:signal transduction histidine kinase/ActR/RegA family two-component response regulator